MFKKLFLPLIAFTALFAGLAFTPSANAHHGRSSFRPINFTRCYHVMYRDCSFEPWRCYGRFDCYREARHVAHRLRCRGYQVYIR